MARAASSDNPEVRTKAYSAAIKRITEQAYWVPLHTYVTTYGFSKQLDFTPYRRRAAALLSGEVEIGAARYAMTVEVRPSKAG